MWLTTWAVLLRGVGLKHHQDSRFVGLRGQVQEVQWPPPEAPPDRDWLWLVTDKCTANITPVCFLQYEAGCMVGWYGDPNHEPWNEVKLSASDAGFGEMFKVCMVLASCLYGPWDTGGFWRKTLDAASEYKQVANLQCPIFRYLLPKIAEDS